MFSCGTRVFGFFVSWFLFYLFLFFNIVNNIILRILFYFIPVPKETGGAGRMPPLPNDK